MGSQVANLRHGRLQVCATRRNNNTLKMTTLETLRKDFPTAALKRDQIVEMFKRCGLGGLEFYKDLKASGTLIPLRNLPGAKQARYDREHVLGLIADAMTPSR